MDDDELEEGAEEMDIYQIEAQPELLTNENSWGEHVERYHALDALVCVSGLASNISASFAVFWRDMRNDLCAARNKTVQDATVKDFDAQLMTLSVADLEPS